MSFLGVVTLVGQQKIAASIGGTPLNLTTIRVGDGFGSPITPNEAMTDLVRRVGTAYGITSAGPDPVDPNIWRVTAVIDETQGPFDIREIAVFDDDGDMIAIASHPLVEKRTTGEGAAVSLETDIIFPVSETAQVSVTLAQENAASIADMLRPAFIVVDSATLTSPPTTPALGDTYLVPTGATGAWSGSVNSLAQWNGNVWAIAEVPAGHIVVDKSKAIDNDARWLRRQADGTWTTARASATALGLVELATNEEVQGGVDDKRAVTPASLSARTGTATRTGLVRLATQNEANNGTEPGAVVTPAILRGLQVPNFRFERISLNLAENTETTTFNFDSGFGLILMPNSTWANNVLTIGEPGLWDFVVAVRASPLTAAGLLEVGLLVNGVLATTAVAAKTADFTEALGATYFETRTIPTGATIQPRVKHRNTAGANRDLYVRFLGKRVAN